MSEDWVGILYELPLYRFRYLDDERVHIGRMAQDVARVRPDAVIVGPDGYLQIDYGRLFGDLPPHNDRRNLPAHGYENRSNAIQINGLSATATGAATE